ncbi:cilium assembly protein DZIP1 [Cydia fagiglandana]|uniref:cilium assembly protein DZIP1 n=1 Tax=Cydia fagiglandana TaxID=1458189 RepID=UPI002FEE1739
MACKTSYELHHNFPRLAEETGFAFNTHRPRIHIDWNKIRLIDIDSLTRDRKFALLEQHVNDILDCVLESEFDVRILDEGVVKLFRLAQLAVEYQQFCRHYLDRSVFVLRQEIDTLAQELANAKKDLQEKEDELRKSRRKSKPHYKPLLPYGNDNIAAMILKTLTNKADIFPSTASGEVPQYNKCHLCDKVFLNQLYLKSHISRRHAKLLDELPERDVKQTGPTEVNKIDSESNKLNEEINQLKMKIKEMEVLITNNNKVLIDNEVIKTNDRVASNKSKEMRDVGVYADNDDVFKKLEEWKKTEQANHTKEIDMLRNQIFETLNSLKVKEIEKPNESDKSIIEQLHKTIKDQGAEILSLQQALTQTKIKSDNDDMERKKDIEEQMLHWVRRDEAQSKQYEMLVQKLNEVAKEARESRAAAEAERQRAGQLEALLKERLRHTQASGSSDGGSVSNTQEECDDTDPIDEPKMIKPPNTAVKDNSLEQLHRKAQELLNMDSSSTSDASNSETFFNNQTVKITANTVNEKSASKGHVKKYLKQHDENTPSKKNNTEMQKHKAISINKTNDKRIVAQKQKKTKKDSVHQKEQLKQSPHLIIKQQNGPIIPPGSPLKVIRAKITEEVNSRLVQAGVDPLKSRLNQNLFQKQKAQLQQQLEIKTKKYPAYEQVRYTIMAYLDSDASGKKADVMLENNMTATNAFTKAFSLSSMISNVKSKALSLVKNKEVKTKSKHKSSEFAKKALRLLKTPPESPVVTNVPHSSPPVSDEDEIFDRRLNYKTTTEDKTVKPRLIKRKTKLPTQSHLESDSDETPPNTNPSIPQRPARSIDNLIRSPARRPSSATADYSNTILKYTSRSNDDHLIRTQSAIDILEFGAEDREINNKEQKTPSNDDIQELLEIKKVPKTDSNRSPRQTKSVLKNASSTSSLNKKKVIFDMDAIQMKSVSASPSQSLTEKSDDKYELGLINIGDDEWDISSIENEPIKSDTKIRVNVGQSPKIAELKQTIEAQLARRSETPSTALFGGVDVLRGPMTKSSNVGGSNTSLGSSILDESDSAKVLSQKNISVVKPKHNAGKDDSELDISDFSVDGVTNKNEKDSF